MFSQGVLLSCLNLPDRLVYSQRLSQIFSSISSGSVLTFSCAVYTASKA